MAVPKPTLIPQQFAPDERQREAIEHVHGPMLVLAGAGTGKTTVLTRRITRLVRENLASPGKFWRLPKPQTVRMRYRTAYRRDCPGPRSRRRREVRFLR